MKHTKGKKILLQFLDLVVRDSFGIFAAKKIEVRKGSIFILRNGDI